MKHSLLFIILVALICSSGWTQSVPQGMKYQAVARDLSGNVLANQQIALKITLHSDIERNAIEYSESHVITTNEVGLFTLVVGDGSVLEGAFDDVPWSSKDIWMEVAFKDENTSSYNTISNSKLLAVPYAFHAATASKLIERSYNRSLGDDGVNSQTWSLFGNKGTDDTKDRLGTTDCADLVVITDNLERLRITCEGIVNVDDDLNIGGDLTVKNMASTHLTGTLEVDKATTLNDDLSVKNMASTHLTGDLDVDKTLNVDGATTLNSTLLVEGDATFNSDVNVNGGLGGSSLLITGNDFHFVATIVNENNSQGDGLKIKLGKEKSSNGIPDLDEIVDITPEQQVQIKNLFDKEVSEDAKIVILGELFASAFKDDIETIAGVAVGVGNLIVGFINQELNLPYDIGEPINETLKLPYDFGTKISNEIGLPYNIGSKINNELNLPFDIGTKINRELNLPYNIGSEINNGIDLPIKIAQAINDGLGLPYKIAGETVIPALPSLNVPAIPGSVRIPHIPAGNVRIPQIPANTIKIPEIPDGTVEFPALDGIVIKKIPEIDIAALGDLLGLDIDTIDVTDPSFWGIPSLDLNDFILDPLNNENEFIQFADVNDEKLGSIKAMSVADWVVDYLNPIALNRFFSALKSSVVDKKHALYHVKQKGIEYAKSYVKIGVEYSSGFGDYAEWLERMDPKESIKSGHIVAVVGGKITKDLSNAEQVMVVSHNPIILGNVPIEGKSHLGNKVAFMGQVPVKIMGPVASGDYIIGNNDTPGYGYAKSPSEMTAEDFKLCVGRSWDNDPSKGPIMVNTVVGVHNGDYIRLLKKHEQKLMEAETRIESLESNMDTVLKILRTYSNIN